MKKLELVFAALLVPLDYAVLLVAALLAYHLRFTAFVTDLRPVIFAMSQADFLKIAALVAIAWLIIFALNGLYDLKRRSLFSYWSKIFVACSAATLLIVVAFFFNFQLFSSRLIIITTWLLSIIFVSLERFIIYYIKKLFYKKGYGVRRVVVIGSSKNAQDLINEFNSKPSYGFKVIKHFPTFNSSAESELNKLIKSTNVDDVVLGDANLSEEQKSQLVNLCLVNHLNYKYAASLLETKVINFELSTVAGVPLIEVKQTRLDGWGRIIKRLFDLIMALILLILLSWLMLIVGILVIITSAGPMIVKLERVGSSGNKFRLYKFRSMVKDAHKMKPLLKQYNERLDGPLFKMENDPRITPLGKVIRKWSLDELPQLINVLIGNMSLVGPRPHEPEEVAQYQTSQQKLLAIKPGITGMAQVSGRSDLSWDEEVRLDTYYVENWRLGLDIQILLKTPKAVFSKRRAA